MHEQHDNHGVTGLEIAIVGLAGRFPGAPDVETFWLNIRDGVESVQHYTDTELRERGVPENLLTDPNYVKAGVPFDGVDLFDAALFGYTPRDAEQLDPQHRIFLECAWEALENAGYDPQRYRGSVGVYAGSGASLYLIRQLLPHYDLENGGNVADLLGLLSGNLADALCTRIAYKLNLRGPAVTVQTACSTSLMAVHTACQALLGHECDMALAGGVSLNLLQNGGYRYQAGAIFSPDGHCRAFDARAAGTLLGSGAGIVVLKRLEDALRDGDTIHAVIKGSAANNDGSNKVGFTAPSVSGQAEVIQTAQALAEVPAATIGYIEAHGTGTTLGDPIEIAALIQAFQARGDSGIRCAIGSVKTNVGHLDAAAGVTGLIKAVMVLRHRILPASLNFDEPNPQIDFSSSPFYVNTRSKPWPASDIPRRAGVSSFGIGGTNVHLVLEEAPPVAGAVQHTERPQFLPLSARTPTALTSVISNLASHLKQYTEQAMEDVAYTLHRGRRRFAHRAVALANNREDAIQTLTQQDPATFFCGEVLSEYPTVAFLFPGQGAQHANMGRALYEREATFQETIDYCCERLRPNLGLDLRELLFPEARNEREVTARLAQTAITQPALFVVEYALAQWWIQQGIQPDAMLGHSIGEYVAACVAGVFTLDDALTVVAERGRLLQATAPGAMLAVSLHEVELQSRLPEGCDIAAVNATDLCVIAGSPEAIDRAEQDMACQDAAVQRLHVTRAFHSALVEPMLDKFRALLSRIELSQPKIPFVSNLSGRWITAEEARSPEYWVRHVRGAVRFADGLDELLSKADRVLLEVGPGEILSTLARRHPQVATRQVFASQCHPQRASYNTDQPVRCLAQLWVAGVDVNTAFQRANGRRVPLPTYPFERQSYWVDPPNKATGKMLATTTPRTPDDWFYRPSWKRTEAMALNTDMLASSDGALLILSDASGPGDFLLRHWQSLEKPLVHVQPGECFTRLEAGHYAVRPGNRDDFATLLREVEAGIGPVAHIHHLWSLDAEDCPRAAEEILERGFYSLLALAQALDTVAGERQIAITVVANQLGDVTGTESLCAEKATLHGPCKVIPQEYPQITCRLIDVQLPVEPSLQDRLVRQITAEISAEIQGEKGVQRSESLVAYRGTHRWVRTYESVGREAPGAQGLREQGVYLITGGLGGIGLTLARYLARQWQARLVLLGRSASPDKAEAVAELETMGAEVLVIQADMADCGQVRAAIDKTRRHFGDLHGVIHAAGVPGGGMIAQRDRAAVERVFAPKLWGTRNLLEALDGEELDFIAFCSSLASFAGGMGKVDYAAANAYLDAVAVMAMRTSERNVVSINWDGWRDVGMAADLQLPEHVGIAPERGVLAFGRIVSGPAQPQTIVSTTDLHARLSMVGEEFLTFAVPDLSGNISRSSHPRPNLQSPYEAPSGDLESGLAHIWGDFLGIEPIGIDDNLFELGGDSLLAIQLLAKLRSVYGVELHPAGFFKQPTVRALALQVEERLIADIENADSATDRTSEIA